MEQGPRLSPDLPAYTGCPLERGHRPLGRLSRVCTTTIPIRAFPSTPSPLDAGPIADGQCVPHARPSAPYSMNARTWHHLYKKARWLQRRKAQLSSQPLCEWCLKRGQVTPANIAHHNEPHKGDLHKFYHGPLTSLCKQCHDSEAQSIERGGKPKQTIGPDGWPAP